MKLQVFTLAPCILIHYYELMTDLNKAVLEFIQSYYKEKFEPPSLWTIAKKFEWKSHNSASRHIKILVRNGLLTKLPSGRHIPTPS